MSIFKQCFSGETVDIRNEKKWYKQPNNKTSLKGSIYSKKISTINDQTNIHSIDQPKLSHFYNQRSPDGYISGGINSEQIQLKRLRQQNIRLKKVIQNQIQPLKVRYQQLVHQNKTKSQIIESLQRSLGFRVNKY